MKRCLPLLPEFGIIWYDTSVCQLIKILYVDLFGPEFLLNITLSDFSELREKSTGKIQSWQF